MPSNVRFNIAEFERRFEREMGRRLDACAIAVQDRAKVLIGREGAAPAAASRTTKTGRKIRKGSLVYGARRSAPGEPPMKQTGRLQSSVAHERSGMTARVGTNVIYGRWLELGTTHVAARPWLRRSLVEMTPAVNGIISKPMDF